jgi:hypothetical protein
VELPDESCCIASLGEHSGIAQRFVKLTPR